LNLVTEVKHVYLKDLDLQSQHFALSLTVKLPRRKFYKNHGLSNNWHENMFFLITSSRLRTRLPLSLLAFIGSSSFPLRDDLIYGRNDSAVPQMTKTRNVANGMHLAAPSFPSLSPLRSHAALRGTQLAGRLLFILR